MGLFFVGSFRYESHLGYSIRDGVLVVLLIPSGQVPDWYHYYLKNISF